jgi:hypothetical protein
MDRRARLHSSLRRTWQRQLRLSDSFWFAVMSLATLMIVYFNSMMPTVATPSLLIVTLLFGGLFLGIRALLYLIVVVGIALTVMAVRGGVLVGQVIGVAISSVLVFWWVRFRSLLGLRGRSSELLLVDLRDQLISHGRVPALPRDWLVDVQISPAHGSAFAGDFVVAYLNQDQTSLDIVVVDVSGKGADAAARALMLQGAMGGLLGATSFGGFFPATNDFLLRQVWEDGFATAAHVRLDLATGKFRSALAGHPPIARFAFGSGKWTTMGTPGPLLGVTQDIYFDVSTDQLDVGDALILYTDGVIEVPGRDLLFGIDKLLGEAERLVARSWKSGARSLIDSVAESPNDDRAVILIRRLPRHTT